MNNKKEYDKNYRETHRGQDKNKLCPDCSKKIWSGSKRCKHCARKEQYRLHPETNPQFGKVGELASNYKHGKTYNNKCIDCGKKISYGSKRCKSCARKEQYKNPENHPQWLGGIGKLPYSIEWTEELRNFIRKRDNYQCQNCSMTEEEHIIVLGKVLNIHHIDYNKLNCSKENLITLCMSCNIRANFNRNYWLELYLAKINILTSSKTKDK